MVMMVIFAVIGGIVSLTCAVIAGIMAIKGRDQDDWMPFLYAAGVSLFLLGLALSDFYGHR